MFVDRSYKESSTESVLYIHSIYDQFLPPVSTSSPPSTGISEDLTDYFLHRERLRVTNEVQENDSSTPEDEFFAECILKHAGTFLHLGIFNQFN